MLSPEFISVLFRLINVAVTVGAAVYLFKRYGLNVVKNKIRARKQLLEDLHAQQVASEHQCKDKEQQIIEQHLLFQALQKKIEVWRQHFEQRVVEREHEKEHIRASLEKKVAEQSRFLNVRQMQQAIVPGAVKKAREELKAYFESEQAGRVYLAPIVNHIKKSMS